MGGGGGGGGVERGGEKRSVREFFLSPLICKIFFSEAQALQEFFFPHIFSFVTKIRFT